MRKIKLLESLSEVLDIFILRLKIIRRDVITVTVLLASVLLFGILIQSLTSTAEEYSSLPVGVVDYDQSASSKKLIHSLMQVNTIRILEGEEQELQKLLMDEMISSLFLIEKGYERNLISGKLIDLVSMRYKEDNQSVSIISDIFAAEILYPACLYKSFHYYEQLPREEKMLTIEEYLDRMDKLLQTEDEFNFAFQFHYDNHLGDSIGVKISNAVLYQQLIFGILGLMMGFNAMFLLSQTVEDKEKGIVSRQSITRYRRLKRDFGNLLALLVWEGILSLLFTLLMLYHFNRLDIESFIGFFLLFLLNSIVLGGCMLLLTKLINRIITYQILCTVLLLITGGFGFYRLISGFYQDTMGNLAKFIPNSWFIKGLTDIIIYNNKKVIFNIGHLILIVMAVILLLFIIGIDLLQELNILKRKKRIGR